MQNLLLRIISYEDTGVKKSSISYQYYFNFVFLQKTSIYYLGTSLITYFRLYSSSTHLQKIPDIIIRSASRVHLCAPIRLLTSSATEIYRKSPSPRIVVAQILSNTLASVLRAWRVFSGVQEIFRSYYQR